MQRGVAEVVLDVDVVDGRVEQIGHGEGKPDWLAKAPSGEPVDRQRP